MNDTPAIPEIVCRKCKTVVGAADNYCRHCGAPTSQWAEAHSQPWWDHSWIAIPLVLFLLFLVLGAFGLPLLWRSRHFSWFWKIALTVIVIAYTVWIVWLTWNAVYPMYQSIITQLQELQNFR